MVDIPPDSFESGFFLCVSNEWGLRGLQAAARQRVRLSNRLKVSGTSMGVWTIFST